MFDLRNLSLFWEKNLKNGVRKSHTGYSWIGLVSEV